MFDAIGRIAFVSVPAAAVFFVLTVLLLRYTEGLEGVPRAILGGALGAVAWIVFALWVAT